MGCCGQRRARVVAALAARPRAASPAPPPPARLPAPAAASPARAIAGVLIRYVERQESQVIGPRTGRIYRFSTVAPLQLVATPDVPALLAMRQFRRA